MQDRIVRQLIHALEYAMKDAIAERLSKYPDKSFEPQGLIYNTVTEDHDKEVYVNTVERIYLDTLRDPQVVVRTEYQDGDCDTDTFPFDELPIDEELEIFGMLQI